MSKQLMPLRMDKGFNFWLEDIRKRKNVPKVEITRQIVQHKYLFDAILTDEKFMRQTTELLRQHLKEKQLKDDWGHILGFGKK